MYTESELRTFTAGYVMAMEFANEEIFPYYEHSPELDEKIKQDCAKFLDAAHLVLRKCDNYKLFRYVFNQAGHDFYFTRCGHGVGFWESEWNLPNGSPIFSNYFTKLSKQFGNIDVYVGDDNLIYQA